MNLNASIFALIAFLALSACGRRDATSLPQSGGPIDSVICTMDYRANQVVEVTNVDSAVNLSLEILHSRGQESPFFVDYDASQRKVFYRFAAYGLTSYSVRLLRSGVKIADSGAVAVAPYVCHPEAKHTILNLP